MGISRDSIKHSIGYAGFFRQCQQRKRAESGVLLAGLITPVQPAASAGPSLRVSIAIGKFHGVIAATTPIGSRVARMREPGFSRRNDLAVSALCLLSKPLNKAGGILHFTFRFFQGFALFRGHQLPEPAFILDN